MNTHLEEDFHIKVSKGVDAATLHLDGNFNFRAYSLFKDAYVKLLDDSIVNSVSIDLARVERLDSFALGMLLILRDRVRHAGKNLSLIRPSKIVKKSFDIANFSRIFSIH